MVDTNSDMDLPNANKHFIRLENSKTPRDLKSPSWLIMDTGSQISINLEYFRCRGA